MEKLNINNFLLKIPTEFDIWNEISFTDGILCEDNPDFLFINYVDDDDLTWAVVIEMTKGILYYHSIENRKIFYNSEYYCIIVKDHGYENIKQCLDNA